VVALQAGLIAALLVHRRRSRTAAVALEHERNVAAHAARLATLGELSASIAHEISQPLAAILSNAEAGELLLDAKPHSADSLKEILADIRSNDLRARDVVRRVRALAQRRTPGLQLIDLNEVMADARRLLEADAPRRGVTFDWDLAPVPPVDGDPVQLQHRAAAFSSRRVVSATGWNCRCVTTVPAFVTSTPHNYSSRSSRGRRTALDSDFRSHGRW